MTLDTFVTQRPADPTPQIATDELDVRIPMSGLVLGTTSTVRCTAATHPHEGSMPAYHH